MNNNDKTHCFKLRKDYLVVDQKDYIELNLWILFSTLIGLNAYKK